MQNCHLLPWARAQRTRRGRGETGVQDREVQRGGRQCTVASSGVTASRKRRERVWRGELGLDKGEEWGELGCRGEKGSTSAFIGRKREREGRRGGGEWGVGGH
jgi:hypothetical protein